MKGRIVNPYKRYLGCYTPNWLAERQDIRPGAKMVWARLAQYAGKSGVAYPKIDTLAESVGLKRRQCCTYLSQLIEAGVLIRDRSGGGRSNRYRFVEPVDVGATAFKEGLFDDVQDTAHQEESRCAGYCTSDVQDTAHQEPRHLIERKESIKRGASRRKAADAPVRKSRRRGDPLHRPLCDLFCQKWEASRGAKYPFSRRDAVAISAIIVHLRETAAGRELEIAGSIFDRYLADDEEFVRAKQGHSLHWLGLNLHRWVAKAAAASARAKSLDSQTARNAAERQRQARHEADVARVVAAIPVPDLPHLISEFKAWSGRPHARDPDVSTNWAFREWLFEKHREKEKGSAA